VNEVYKNAFTEVYEIINNLDNNDYNKIPKEVIQAIESNRNKEYEYFFDETIPLIEQNMLPETKAILFNFFRDYLSTKEQKEKIINFQRNQREELEVEKKGKYNIDIFSKKENADISNNLVEEISIVKVEKNNFLSKLTVIIRNIFNKFCK